MIAYQPVIGSYYWSLAMTKVGMPALGADSAEAAYSRIVELLTKEGYWSAASSSVAAEAGKILAIDQEGLLALAVHVWLREEYAHGKSEAYAAFDGRADAERRILMAEHATRFQAEFRAALGADAGRSRRMMRDTVAEAFSDLHRILRDDDFRKDLASIKQSMGIASRRGEEEPSYSRHDLAALHARLRQVGGDPEAREATERLYAIELVTIMLFEDISAQRIPELQGMLRKMAAVTPSGQPDAAHAASSSFSGLAANLLGN